MTIRDRVAGEPVAAAALIRALAVLAGAFGLQFTAEECAAVLVVAELITAPLTRASVSPVHTDAERRRPPSPPHTRRH